MLAPTKHPTPNSLIALAFVLSFALVSGCGGGQPAPDAEGAPVEQASAKAPAASWDTFITPDDLHAWQGDSSLVIVDARPADQYAQGHIPGAINLPGSLWRTLSRKPGEGSSKYIFRTSDGSVNGARYANFLGQAGISNDSRVVVYGHHGGKKTGTIPVMILKGLGHEKAYFLDGIGLKQWKQAGYEVSTKPNTLAPTTYEAHPDSGFVWNLEDVLQGINQRDVVIVDTRSKAEYTGENPRDNKRGGHIPGAVRVNYSDLMHWPDRTTLPPAEAQQVLFEKGLRGKEDTTYVLHCQTATRVSENYLVMKAPGLRKRSRLRCQLARVRQPRRHTDRHRSEAQSGELVQGNVSGPVRFEAAGG